MRHDVRCGLYFQPLADADNAPDGPGWYLFASIGSPETQFPNEIIPRVRLTNEEAAKFAKVVDNFANGKPLNWGPGKREDITFTDAVEEATQAGAYIIGEQLEAAKSAVKTLENLRRRAQEFGIDPDVLDAES